VRKNVPNRPTLIDFKTDMLVAGSADTAFPQYEAQVQAYARLLRESASAPAVRAGLLFTATGDVRWVP
jgi:ATP-dependent exoDNAse (exonuclease V) beta subunit